MDVKDVIAAAEDQGWEVTRTKKGHLQFIPPDPTRPMVHGSGTPSDWRSLKNLIAQLRRSGLVWPPKR
jgi:predicted RNA binding protein YcfA (HicA-like mRNA interferase family)